jgi:hypothetical protein
MAALAPARAGEAVGPLTAGCVFLDPQRKCSHESVFGGPQAEGVGRGIEAYERTATVLQPG